MSMDGGFSVGQTSRGGASVLTPTGSLTFETCAEFKAALALAGQEPRAMVIVDCRQVKAMDSKALELLVEQHRRLSDGGGSLRLAHLNDVCTDILMVTRLIHVLTVHEGLDGAVQGV